MNHSLSFCEASNRRERAPRRLRSFTLVEILVVITVIAILVALLIPALTHARKKAKYTRWRGYAQQLRADDRLMLYYTFEDGDGSTNVENQAVGSGLPGIYTPSQGNAILTGGMKISRANSRWPGLKGGIYFPGSSGGYLYAQRFLWPYSTSMAKTAMFWVYVSSADRAADPISPIYSVGNRGNPDRCEGWIDAGGNLIHLNGRDPQGKQTQTGFTANYLNRWVHIAMVSAGIGTSSQQIIYINGQPVATGNFDIQGPNIPLTSAYLGAMPVWGGSYTAAQFKLDEFAFFSRALSPAEIERHYRSGKP